MKQVASKPRISPPRRFLLLPEELGHRPGRAPRIRRYRLTSVGRRSGTDGAEVATALMARELSRLGRT